jgi:cysteinyl-tRNA synthetase
MGAAELVTLARSVGLLEARVEAGPAVDGKLKAHIDSLIWLREEARKKRDFAEADRLRAELEKMNVVLEDGREGTTWRLRR